MFEGREIKQGQIYFAWLPKVEDVQKGEQIGNRPVIILQNDKGNRFSPTVVVAKISSKIYKYDKVPTHVRIGAKEGLNGESMVLLEQISTINKNRLKKYIGSVDRIKMKEINRAKNISMGKVRTIDSLPTHIRESIEDNLKLLKNYISIINTTKSNMVKEHLKTEKEGVIRELKYLCRENRVDLRTIVEEEREYEVMEG